MYLCAEVCIQVVCGCVHSCVCVHMSRLSTVLCESELIGLIYTYFGDRLWFWNCAKFIRSLPADIKSELNTKLIEEVDKASQYYSDPVESQFQVVAEVEDQLLEHIARTASLEYQLAAEVGIKFTYILGAFHPVAFKSVAVQTDLPGPSLQDIVCQGNWPQCALHLAYLQAKHSKKQ